MIELKNGCDLMFSFADVHPLANLSINFQRTLRIPDNDQVYPLPPGLGCFPLRHVDDFKSNVPTSWITHGGVMFPMYQAEAMWLYFKPVYAPSRASTYPFAIKVSTGKIDAITGGAYSKGLHRNPQDYLIVPGEPWLDGYCVKKGMIRQFVAMPLGEGYTAEEQITHRAEHGGLQIVVYPMKGHVYEQRYPHVEPRASSGAWGAPACAPSPSSAPMQSFWGQAAQPQLGLAPGGRMHQEIFKDSFDINDWDQEHASRCFVHLANSLAWRNITGQLPPHQPPSAQEYTQFGFPWFDYYDEQRIAVGGSSKLASLTSVQVMSQKKGEPIPNKPVHPTPAVHLRPGQVREEDF